jgi:hypothetical protein
VAVPIGLGDQFREAVPRRFSGGDADTYRRMDTLFTGRKTVGEYRAYRRGDFQTVRGNGVERSPRPRF